VLIGWLVVAIGISGQAATDAPQVAAPKTVATSAEIAALVRELDAAEKARRDAAQAKLLELGPGVLELLPADAKTLPAETRVRLERIRGQLERQRADASVRASRVTLEADPLPLSQVLAAITAQTGNQLIDSRPMFGQQVRDPQVRLKFDKTPFWSALDQTLDEAGLTVYNFAGEGALALVARSPELAPRAEGACYAGAFRVEVHELIARRELRTPPGSGLELNFEVAWEPRIKPIFFLQTTADFTARDDRGQPLVGTTKGSKVEITVNSAATCIESTVHFALPSRDAKRIALFDGKLMALLAGKSEEFRFAELEGAKRLTERVAGCTVTLENVVHNDEAWQFRLTVGYDQADRALESHRNWIFNNEVWLETPTGEKLPYASFETTRQGDNEIGVAYLFAGPKSLAGHKLVYRTPVAIVNLPVEFRLTDLELP